MSEQVLTITNTCNLGSKLAALSHELPPGYDDIISHFLEREKFVHLRACILESRPKEAFHSRRDGDTAAEVVYGSVWSIVICNSFERLITVLIGIHKILFSR